MGDNYQEYALLVSDDPLEQCILYFWDSLEDEIYPKHFLESLLQMVDDIETGKEKVVPLDKDFFDRMKELVRDIEVDLDEKLEEDDGTL
jgi:vacuolar-type H+-ATPase subunit D/Vma8